MKNLLLVSLLAFSSSVLAFGDYEDNSTSQGQAQGQLQGQAQGQLQGQSSHNDNVNLNGNSNRNSSSSGAVGVGIGKGGDSYSEGSTAASGSQSGSTSNSGSTIGIDASHNYDEKANSVGALYSSGCQSAMGVQGDQGGISIIQEDTVCQALRVADGLAKARSHCADDECRAKYDDMIMAQIDIAFDHVDGTSTLSKAATNSMNLLKTLGSVALMAFLF